MTRSWPTLVLALIASVARPAAGQDLAVSAPPALEAVAARLRSLDWRPLTAGLVNAGLDVPSPIRVMLIAEDDTRARTTPWWVVGQATGIADVVIFPARAGSYPYESLESVLRHEVVHLALSARAGERPLPRWFHEGVAVSVETEWSVGGDMRLVLAARSNPGLADLARLFDSDTYLGNADAYRLAAALVNDIRERHGPAIAGQIARRVATGIPFEQAFEIETGETSDAVAARVWSQYRRWTAWLPVVTSESAVWTLILALAFVAFIAQFRRRARRRRRWAEEEEFPRE